MPIAIIVETGVGIANANAYIDVSGIRAYASNRGISLSANDDEVAAMIIKATDYLESLGCKFQGQKTNCEQPLEWPRSGVIICNAEIANDKIPKQLIRAQSQAVLALNEGLVLQPNISASDYVIEETVGPITTKYASPVETGIETKFTALDSLLAPLFYSTCGQAAFALKTIRV